jgi:hypothetical protein
MLGDLLRFVYFICQIGLLPFNNTKEAQDAVVKFAIGISRGAMHTLLPYMAELTERLLGAEWGAPLSLLGIGLRYQHTELRAGSQVVRHLVE